MEEVDETKATASTNAQECNAENDTNNKSKQLTTKNEQTKPSFICGVIEGFYGRPWTTEQRKDLFRK